MGGTLGFSNSPGKGSVFRFDAELPAARTPPEKAADPALAAGPAGEPVPGLRDAGIRIVEDNALNRRAISGMLEIRGSGPDSLGRSARPRGVQGRPEISCALLRVCTLVVPRIIAHSRRRAALRRAPATGSFANLPTARIDGRAAS